MREELDTEIGATTARRREGTGRRFGIPVAVAATAAALAIGGYVLTTDRDGGGPGGSSSQPSAAAGRMPDSSTSSTAGPSQAYQKCFDLAAQHAQAIGEPTLQGLEGKLAVEGDNGITAVVANDAVSYTCNVEPDTAVSHPAPLDGRLEEADLWFALSARPSENPDGIPWEEGMSITEDGQGNLIVVDSQGTVVWSEKDDPDRSEFPGSGGAYRGDMVWAGGEAPSGVTGISYTFPDGHTERAVVRDGFWVMQYYSNEEVPTGRRARVEIVVDGPAGQTYQLPFTIDTMCNQVSHGC